MLTSFIRQFFCKTLPLTKDLPERKLSYKKNIYILAIWGQYSEVGILRSTKKLITTTFLS